MPPSALPPTALPRPGSCWRNTNHCAASTRQRKPRCPLIVRQATCRRADGAVQLLPLRRHTVRSLARGTTGDAQRRTLRQSLPNGVQPAAGVFGLLCFAVLH
jgi:hypothetical protein